jgi:hypothetical protein
VAIETSKCPHERASVEASVEDHSKLEGACRSERPQERAPGTTLAVDQRVPTGASVRRSERPRP